MTEDGGEKQLGILASITAAIEAAQTEIRSVRIKNGAETYDARVQLAIPLSEVSGLDRARIETDHTEVVDNDLRFELTLEINGIDQSDPNASHSVSRGQNETESSQIGGVELTDHSGAEPHRARKTNDADDQAPDGETTETEPVVGTGPERAGSESPEQTRTDDEDWEEKPGYQDPEQLAAVYDENATFEEMRDELGVDVTAQTVRKYMIKHGIHEPEPRPDRLLETIRASELELMNSEYDRRTEQADRSTKSDGE